MIYFVAINTINYIYDFADEFNFLRNSSCKG